MLYIIIDFHFCKFLKQVLEHTRDIFYCTFTVMSQTKRTENNIDRSQFVTETKYLIAYLYSKQYVTVQDQIACRDGNNGQRRDKGFIASRVDNNKLFSRYRSKRNVGAAKRRLVHAVASLETFGLIGFYWKTFELKTSETYPLNVAVLLLRSHSGLI